MQEKQLRRRVLIEQSQTADQGQEVDHLKKKNGYDFPDHRQDIGKDLETSDLIKGGREETAQEWDLFEGVQNTIDPIGVLQRKGNAQCFKHRLPLSALQ